MGTTREEDVTGKANASFFLAEWPSSAIITDSFATIDTRDSKFPGKVT